MRTASPLHTKALPSATGGIVCQGPQLAWNQRVEPLYEQFWPWKWVLEMGRGYPGAHRMSGDCEGRSNARRLPLRLKDTISSPVEQVQGRHIALSPTQIHGSGERAWVSHQL